MPQHVSGEIIEDLILEVLTTTALEEVGDQVLWPKHIKEVWDLKLSGAIPFDKSFEAWTEG